MQLQRQASVVLTTIRNKTLAGVAVAIPIIVTFWVLNLAYGFISSMSRPLLERIDKQFLNNFFAQNHGFWGLDFLLTLLLLFSLGVFATNVLGRKLLEGAERVLLRVPLVATIYTGVKQVMDSFKSFNSGMSFKRVAYVEYPSEGCKLIGFVTGQFYDPALKRERTAIFLPTSPNPMTGFIVVVDAEKVIASDLTLEEATKMIFSAGLVAPKRERPEEPHSAASPAPSIPVGAAMGEPLASPSSKIAD